MEIKKQSVWKKLIIVTLISCVFLSAITYAGFAMFFSDHYYYQTIINGSDYSYKTPMEAEDMIRQQLQTYFLEVEGRESMNDTIMLADIEVEYIFTDTLLGIKQEQNPAFWILGIFRKFSYDIPQLVEYNEDMLEERIQALAFFQSDNIKPPNAAYISYFEEEKKYTVVKSSPGTEIIKGRTEEVIKDAVRNMERKINLEEMECYKFPLAIEEDEILKKLADQANQYVSAKITYNWNGSNVIVDADLISEWVVLEKNKVSLDEEKIREFVVERSKENDTYGKNRMFRTSDGRELELRSGAYGWRTNREAEVEALIAAVQNGEILEKEPEYSFTAAQSGKDDIGSTYVEIDLGKQRLYLYVDGEVVLESDFVSGNTSRGWNTPAGVFGLTYKTKNAVLRGEDYETPVNYWMPFNGNIGMHDATWRGTFGGEIYQTNGSHGCINLPLENAKIIYEYLYTGFPVVCYY